MQLTKTSSLLYFSVLLVLSGIRQIAAAECNCYNVVTNTVDAVNTGNCCGPPISGSLSGNGCEIEPLALQIKFGACCGLDGDIYLCE